MMDFVDMKKRCSERIKAKLDLIQAPQIGILERSFNRLPDGWNYELKKVKNIIEPVDQYYRSSFFDVNDEPLNPVMEFQSMYPHLFYLSDKNGPYEIQVTEVIINLGKIKVSAGMNQTITSTLKNGRKCTAVMMLEVRELFRRCGLATLLKISEVAKARRDKCDIIQTFHESNNRHFAGAIIPSLRNGFILYHGPNKCGEGYEESGYIHLRRYLTGNFYSEVTMDGMAKPIISPDQNSVIINHLKESRKINKGLLFTKIGKPKKKRSRKK